MLPETVYNFILFIKYIVKIISIVKDDQESSFIRFQSKLIK